MQTSLFDYSLPVEKIAQHPLEPRDASKLLISRQNTKDKGQNNGFEETLFRDITTLLHPGDCLVVNDTKVMPARILGYTFLQEQRAKIREKKDGIFDDSELKTENSKLKTKKVECLFLRNTAPDIWEIMCFPGERLKTGREIILENGMTLEIVGETYAGRLVKVPVPHHEWLEILKQYGEIPLPPYITEKLANSETYQTVYAEHLGSTASPTAGRHFTPELLEKIKAMWVAIAHVTLHIGPGTFKPIYEETIDTYQIHSEFVTIPAETIDMLEATKNHWGRIIAVGTTSMRSLESFAFWKLAQQREENKEQWGGFFDDARNWSNNPGNSYSGDTDLYITPGYQFQMVDVLITNFHAPRTSLLVLVAAFMGFDHMIAAYEYALAYDFRFLSFGDAMWVERKTEK